MKNSTFLLSIFLIVPILVNAQSDPKDYFNNGNLARFNFSKYAGLDPSFDASKVSKDATKRAITELRNQNKYGFSRLSLESQRVIIQISNSHKQNRFGYYSTLFSQAKYNSYEEMKQSVDNGVFKYNLNRASYNALSTINNWVDFTKDAFSLYDGISGYDISKKYGVKMYGVLANTILNSTTEILEMVVDEGASQFLSPEATYTMLQNFARNCNSDECINMLDESIINNSNFQNLSQEAKIKFAEQTIQSIVRQVDKNTIQIDENTGKIQDLEQQQDATQAEMNQKFVKHKGRIDALEKHQKQHTKKLAGFIKAQHQVNKTFMGAINDLNKRSDVMEKDINENRGRIDTLYKKVNNLGRDVLMIKEAMYGNLSRSEKLRWLNSNAISIKNQEAEKIKLQQLVALDSAKTYVNYASQSLQVLKNLGLKGVEDLETALALGQKAFEISDLIISGGTGNYLNAAIGVSGLISGFGGRKKNREAEAIMQQFRAINIKLDQLLVNDSIIIANQAQIMENQYNMIQMIGEVYGSILDLQKQNQRQFIILHNRLEKIEREVLINRYSLANILFAPDVNTCNEFFIEKENIYQPDLFGIESAFENCFKFVQNVNRSVTYSGVVPDFLRMDVNNTTGTSESIKWANIYSQDYFRESYNYANSSRESPYDSKNLFSISTQRELDSDYSIPTNLQQQQLLATNQLINPYALEQAFNWTSSIVDYWPLFNNEFKLVPFEKDSLDFGIDSVFVGNTIKTKWQFYNAFLDMAEVGIMQYNLLSGLDFIDDLASQILNNEASPNGLLFKNDLARSNAMLRLIRKTIENDSLKSDINYGVAYASANPELIEDFFPQGHQLTFIQKSALTTEGKEINTWFYELGDDGHEFALPTPALLTSGAYHVASNELAVLWDLREQLILRKSSFKYTTQSTRSLTIEEISKRKIVHEILYDLTLK